MLLRHALHANAAFSTTTGLAMVLAPRRLAAVLGVDTPWLLAAIGAALLVFAFDLVAFSRRPQWLPRIGAAAVLGDLAWVAGTGLLAWQAPGALGPQGWLAADLVAVVVAGFALTQTIGLAQLRRSAAAA